jgi:hypothetical protein
MNTQFLTALDADLVSIGTGARELYGSLGQIGQVWLQLVALVALTLVLRQMRLSRPGASAPQMLADWLTWAAGAALWVWLTGQLWRSAPWLGLPLAGTLCLLYVLWAGNTARNFATFDARLIVRVACVTGDQWDRTALCQCEATNDSPCYVYVEREHARLGAPLVVSIRRSALTGKNLGEAVCEGPLRPSAAPTSA